MQTPDLTTLVREIVREELRVRSDRVPAVTPRSLRCAAGVSLEDLSKKACISMEQILHIEEGNLQYVTTRSILENLSRHLGRPEYVDASYDWHEYVQGRNREE